MNAEPQPGRAVVPVQATPGSDVEQLMTLARAFAESGYFADARGWAQAVVKIQAGRELGFGPMASMVGVHIIKGRVTLSANLIASAIRRSGRYDYQLRSLSDQVCEIMFLAGGKEVGESVFTIEDARKADLVKGDNWKHYPRNMLFARAISNGAKWYCPDIFSTGVYSDGELNDEPEPIRIPAQVATTQVTREAPAPVAATENNGHGRLTIDEAAALADLRKQLSQGRGVIDREQADTLWLEILGRWGVQSAANMNPDQRKQLVSYLVTQIQADQMKAELEGDAASAAAGGR